MPTRFAASCGMCGQDFAFGTPKERNDWLSGHDPKHFDFVSFFRQAPVSAALNYKEQRMNYYRRFDELPVGTKFVNERGHKQVKTTAGSSRHCAEPPDDDWYYHVNTANSIANEWFT